MDAVSRAGRLGRKGDVVVMSDNFNKFCGVLILLLLGLSTLFTLRASAEDYTPPADVAETTEEETHEVIQVQGVQTYDPQLYEKLDTLQESINTLVDVLLSLIHI